MIEAYRGLKPDLVLLDIVMPEGNRTMNGIEALEKIIKENPSANIVICGALEQQMLIVEALKLSAGFHCETH